MASVLRLIPQQTYNTTLLSHITPTSVQPPFYHTIRPSLLSFIGDKYLSLACPVIGYWVLSGIFHYLDTAKHPYFEKFRLHESPEVIARNKVSMFKCFYMVILQQVTQTILGLLYLEDDATVLKREVYRDHLGELGSLAPGVANLVMVLLGQRTGENFLKHVGSDIVWWTYWWFIPAAQALFFFFCVDTWQYFLHRAFHVFPFLYRNIHSVHHRLYVPYAFGALYNHPLEGILFDSLGAAVAHSLAGLSTRQDILWFTFSTLKTVDDHCGYKIWWDPFQMFFPNNADYHDIHHQAYGIKSNFSQPYFTNWDKLLGTEMTRAQANTKTRRIEKID